MSIKLNLQLSWPKMYIRHNNQIYYISEENLKYIFETYVTSVSEDFFRIYFDDLTVLEVYYA